MVPSTPTTLNCPVPYFSLLSLRDQSKDSPTLFVSFSWCTHPVVEGPLPLVENVLKRPPGEVVGWTHSGTRRTASSPLYHSVSAPTQETLSPFFLFVSRFVTWNYEGSPSTVPLTFHSLGPFVESRGPVTDPLSSDSLW